MRRHRYSLLLLAFMLFDGSVMAEPLTREQALGALGQPGAPARLAGIELLAGIGSMADADHVLALLGDADPDVFAQTGEAARAAWETAIHA